MQTSTPGWWNRNAKWAVPVTVLVVLLAFAGFVFGIVAFVFGMMKSNEAYRGAVSRASVNPAVIAALGKPITAGYFTSGSIKTNGASGAASMAIPISGPSGAATLYVEATQSAGQWTFSQLVVELAGTKQRIDLLAEGVGAAAARTRPRTIVVERTRFNVGAPRLRAREA